MMDRITIRNLEIFGNHGVYPEENILGQKFLIDAELYTDLRKAGHTDQLKDSVSYGDVIRLLHKEMKKQNDKLIEKTTERLAEAVLLTFDKIQRIRLCVKKPWAPVMMHMDHAAVTVERGWHKVYIGAGSNMGDRDAYIRSSASKLRERKDIRFFRSASVRETEPYGYLDQDKFLNTVFEFETLLTPEELFALTSEIEKAAGRKREIHWGPRTLDLDILLYDDLVTEDADLVIPHPEMTRRLFVLEPLCELSPYGVHPLTHERFCDIRHHLAEGAEDFHDPDAKG